MASKSSSVQPVGIDLGTTYSSISYLTPHGQPQTIPNTEGELSTPSVVLFDGDEVVVGTEALRSAVSQPERVVVHAKRFMGDAQKCWVVDGQVYRPRDIASYILRKLLVSAEERIGPVPHAVITVPAQFSEIQRNETVEAGLQAGLERVDIINEPVAAALCYVLSEGMWFAEIANEQTVMVFDLGGGTFDLSLVRYNTHEVRVRASGGDLHLGGLDWNRALETFLCDEFSKSSTSDPRLDRESMQALATEVEQVKRTLSVRSKASSIVQHQGQRKVFAVDRDQFEMLTHDLVQRTEDITKGMLKAHKLGWAHVDAVLVTGGASRMPMIRNMLQRISGTTLNTSLSPDQSICHGAAYYAGMLLSGQKLERTTLNKDASARLASFKQQSVNARALGILVKDVETGERFPHYLIAPNTPLPCAVHQRFGTVSNGQRRVHLHIVESGASDADPHVELGACIVEGLNLNLPAGSPIDVKIRYDEQARVHVEAKDLSSGARAEALIVRKENVTQIPAREEELDAQLVPEPSPKPVPAAQRNTVSTDQLRRTREQRQLHQSYLKADASAAPDANSILHQKTDVQPLQDASSKESSAQKQAAKRKRPASARPPKIKTGPSLDRAERPIPLCNRCGEPLDVHGRCPVCKTEASKPARRPGTAGGVKPRRPSSDTGDEDSTEPMTALPPRKKPKPKLRGD